MSKANALINKSLAIFILCFFFFVFSAFSQDNLEKVNCSGVLEKDGQFITGKKNLTFSIENTDWNEIIQDVIIQEGIYSVALSVPPSLFLSLYLENKPAKLEISVDGLPLSPKTTILWVPYAFIAKQAINALKIAGNPVSGTPQENYILKWNGEAWTPVPDNSSDFDLSEHSATDLDDIISAGSGKIITADEREKLTSIEFNADKTDAENVAAAGAVMEEADPVYSKSPASDLTQVEVDNLRNGKLDDGTKPWTSASNLSSGIISNSLLDSDLQDLSDGQLSASKIQYGDFFINSQGANGQVWKSDGSGRGYWATDNIGGGSPHNGDFRINDGNFNIYANNKQRLKLMNSGMAFFGDISSALFDLQIYSNSSYLRFEGDMDVNGEVEADEIDVNKKLTFNAYDSETPYIIFKKDGNNRIWMGPDNNKASNLNLCFDSNKTGVSIRTFSTEIGYYWGGAIELNDKNGTNTITMRGGRNKSGGEGEIIVKGRIEADYISKQSGTFKIDHPLDPENKYLCHSFVESPDMKNIYDGTIVTDDQGLAIVNLPSYFESLNTDFRYQLTCIGSFANAIILEKIKDNVFTIKTDKPNIEVSWQVTGIRKDAYARDHRIDVEPVKDDFERGTYLYPEGFGQPVSKSLNQVRSKRVEALKSSKSK
jgi:hypothetical protein